jgi:nitroreductase
MVNEIILKRRSIKTFLPGNINDEKIEALFKAASMAPSSMNEQPWSFILAKKEDEDNFNKLLNLMSPKNQIWAKDSSILLVAIAKRNFSLNNKVNKHYIYDVSSAVANLTYQALSIGLYVHQVGGFDVERSRTELNIPDEY